MAGGKPKQQVRNLFCSAAGHDDGGLERGEGLLDEALQLLPEEPLIISLQGVFYALTGERRTGTRLHGQGLCESKIIWARAPYLLSDRLHSRPGRPTRNCFRVAGAECQHWIRMLALFPERPVVSRSLRGLPEFELLVSSLQAKYPDHLGLL